MRNLLLGAVIITGGLLAGCGDEEKVVKEEKVDQTESKEQAEPTQAEKDAKLKEAAVEADFVELNVDSPPVGKEVFLTGEVILTSESELGEALSVTTEEKDGTGMYTILNMSDVTVEMGKTYKVYGSVIGKKADDGTTQILGEIIEEAK